MLANSHASQERGVTVSFPSDLTPEDGVSWADHPRSRVKVRLPRGQTPLIGRVCGRRVYTLLCHWIDRATRPHFRDVSHCPGCKLPQRPFPPGWLACYDEVSFVPYIVQITPTAVESCPDLDARRGVDLRGLTLSLQHESAAGLSAIRAALFGPRLPSMMCPDAVSVRRFLEDMWRLPVGALGEDEES